MSLFATRRFLPLFITQLLGAFNDNVFKNAIVMLITYKLASETPGNAQMLVTMAGALFILPYFLFSATAGQMADKYDRALMARATKLAEIFVMIVASIGFVMNNAYFLLFVLFCLGIQATFFGPIKYALLPQHLRENELIAGNAYIEAGMFLAILLGTIAGGLLILYPNGVFLISTAIMLCAIGGYASSRHIPEAPAPQPDLVLDWNIARQTWRVVAHDRKNVNVFRSILAISWFWTVGAIYLAQFPAYAKDVLHADATVVTLFLAAFSVGIGIGSLLCNVILRGVISARFIPLGGIGMSLFGIDLYFASDLVHGSANLIGAWDFLKLAGGLRIFADLLGFSISAGVYIVPLYAIMQHESDAAYRARTIATNNILNALFMVISSVGAVALLGAHVSIPQIFLLMSVLNLAVAGWIKRAIH